MKKYGWMIFLLAFSLDSFPKKGLSNKTGIILSTICTADTTILLAPIADFIANQAADCLKKINFEDKSANQPDSFNWDFGDNLTSTTQNPTHFYQNSGSYTITLTVQNAQGVSSKQVQIYIPAHLTIISSITNANANFQGISTIKATNIVNAKAITQYRAEKSILLNAGFCADSSSIFQASIGGCSN